MITMTCLNESRSEWIKVKIESEREILVDGRPYIQNEKLSIEDERRLDEAKDLFSDMGAYIEDEYAILKSGRFTIRCKVSRL